MLDKIHFFGKTIRVHWEAIVAVAIVLLIGAVWISGILGRQHIDTMTTAIPETKPDLPQLPVLMYHHLSENPEKLGDYTISPAQFESDLKLLNQRGYTAVSMEQLRTAYSGGDPLPEKSVLITFDDGYYSVYTYAYPLLKQYEMPAVCFILGYYTQMYSDGEKQNVNYAHMTWEQLKEMKESGLIELGSHSYNLHKLRGEGKRYGICINAGETEQQYCEAILEDLSTLSNAMHQNLGEKPDCFAFPFGAICKQAYPILRQMGFDFVFTCEEKVNTLSYEQEKRPVLLGRYNRASHYSTEQLFEKMNLK